MPLMKGIFKKYQTACKAYVSKLQFLVYNFYIKDYFFQCKILFFLLLAYLTSFFILSNEYLFFYKVAVLLRYLIFAVILLHLIYIIIHLFFHNFLLLLLAFLLLFIFLSISPTYLSLRLIRLGCLLAFLILMTFLVLKVNNSKNLSDNLPEELVAFHFFNGLSFVFFILQQLIFEINLIKTFAILQEASKYLQEKTSIIFVASSLFIFIYLLKYFRKSPIHWNRFFFSLAVILIYGSIFFYLYFYPSLFELKIFHSHVSHFLPIYFYLFILCFYLLYFYDESNKKQLNLLFILLFSISQQTDNSFNTILILNYFLISFLPSSSFEAILNKSAFLKRTGLQKIKI